MKINNPKQSLYKKIDIGAIYKDCLLQHKEFIKTNKFAKETEEKYHKVAHKPYKPTPILSFEKKLPQIHQ